MKASDELETVWECSSLVYITVHSINLNIRFLNTSVDCILLQACYSANTSLIQPHICVFYLIVNKHVEPVIKYEYVSIL